MADGEVCLDNQKLKSKKSCELRFFKILLIVYLRIPSARCACGATVTILVRLHCQNLLVVEPRQLRCGSSPIPFDGNKNTPARGVVLLLADGEGFEPPVESPPQRFSRPPHSTALPTIRNFFLFFRRSFKPTVLFADRN